MSHPVVIVLSARGCQYCTKYIGESGNPLDFEKIEPFPVFGGSGWTSSFLRNVITADTSGNSNTSKCKFYHLKYASLQLADVQYSENFSEFKLVNGILTRDLYENFRTDEQFDNTIGSNKQITKKTVRSFHRNGNIADSVEFIFEPYHAVIAKYIPNDVKYCVTNIPQILYVDNDIYTSALLNREPLFVHVSTTKQQKVKKGNKILWIADNSVKGTDKNPIQVVKDILSGRLSILPPNVKPIIIQEQPQKIPVDQQQPQQHQTQPPQHQPQQHQLQPQQIPIAPKLIAQQESPVPSTQPQPSVEPEVQDVKDENKEDINTDGKVVINSCVISRIRIVPHKKR